MIEFTITTTKAVTVDTVLGEERTGGGEVENFIANRKLCVLAKPTSEVFKAILYPEFKYYYNEKRRGNRCEVLLYDRVNQIQYYSK